MDRILDAFKHRLKGRLKAILEELPESVWYQGHWLGVWMAPLGWLYCGLAQLRRWLYQQGWLASYSAPVPVIVVGNLTVGGTGKTPLVLWLAGHLAERGYRPGIALRGYGRQRFDADANFDSGADAGTDSGVRVWMDVKTDANAGLDVDPKVPVGEDSTAGAKAGAGGRRTGPILRRTLEQPRLVPLNADARKFGDEAVLLAQRAGCPVMVCSDRVEAARELAEHCGCNLVITDDGLQHYRLRRQLEILVVDGERGFGNRRCLPAGPLREAVGRRRWVDLLIENGGAGMDALRMQLEPAEAVSLVDPSRRRPLSDFVGQTVTAVAGIGNPQRFFAMLRDLGLTVSARPYPDHYRYSAADLQAWPDGPVLMTEKDAVKCRSFAGTAHWYVPVTAVLEPPLIGALNKVLDRALTPV